MGAMAVVVVAAIFVGIGGVGFAMYRRSQKRKAAAAQHRSAASRGQVQLHPDEGDAGSPPGGLAQPLLNPDDPLAREMAVAAGMDPSAVPEAGAEALQWKRSASDASSASSVRSKGRPEAPAFSDPMPVLSTLGGTAAFGGTGGSAPGFGLTPRPLLGPGAKPGGKGTARGAAAPDPDELACVDPELRRLRQQLRQGDARAEHVAGTNTVMAAEIARLEAAVQEARLRKGLPC